MVFVKILPQGLQNVALMISTIRLAENDDLEASDTILQIGRILGQNGDDNHHKPT